MLVEANSKPHDIVIYTDGSVTRDRSGWGFTVKQDGRTVHEDSGAHRVTTSSLTMEVEAVTHAIQWLASQRDARITHAIILTDSMNLLQKVESGMGCPDWHTAMHSLRLQRLLWIYCPGHAGVSGNERADGLASTADITSGLQLGRAEVLRGLRNFLSTDKPEHHSIDRLKERGVEKGSGRHSTLQGRERSVFNQTNIGTVSRATLGRLLRDWAERVWAFPSATMPSWAETETVGLGAWCRHHCCSMTTMLGWALGATITAAITAVPWQPCWAGRLVPPSLLPSLLFHDNHVGLGAWCRHHCCHHCCSLTTMLGWALGAAITAVPWQHPSVPSLTKGRHLQLCHFTYEQREKGSREIWQLAPLANTACPDAVRFTMGIIHRDVHFDRRRLYIYIYDDYKR